MTSSKLRIKDDLYNRLSPVQTDEMLYKETTKTRSSYGYDHQDSCERPLRYAEECPTQTKFSTKHLTNTSSHLHHDADDDDGDEDDDTTDTEMPPKSAFILRAQFYQNLFAASANLLKKQRPTKRHRVPAPASDGFEADASGDDAGIDEKAEDLSSPLETALAGVGQLQKCLFPSAPAPHGRQESSGGNGAAPEVGCDVDTADEMLEKPSNAFPWLSEATNNNDYTKGNNNHHGTPPHLHHPHHPHHHHHHHHHPHHSHHLTHSAAAAAAAAAAATSSGTQSSVGPASSSTGNCRHPEDTKCRALNCGGGGPPQSPSAGSSLAANEGATPDSSSTTATATAIPNFNQMPVPGGVQGQNPTQGLVHWMSAVMAEHMTSNPHHDPAAVGMHYMWNGPVEQCGQHTKDMDTYGGWPAPRNPMSMKQGYEAKMNPVDHHHHHHHHHHNNLQKGHMIDDGRLLDHHTMQTGAAQMSQLYGARGSSSSSSPGGGLGHAGGGPTNPAAALLVVPQPINATKIGATGLPNGTGRKYQCKMCPQIFTSKADLQLHTQIHMREAKPYKCSQCNKAFANSSYLSQHTRIHLGIKPYRCEICQRKFTQLSHLQQHIRTHTGDKPYKCRHSGCLKAFSQLSNLQSHSRCHQTDKPYKCNSCYKCFADEPALLEHIPKHKESKHLKTHICQYCGKSYTQETYLSKHMQKHAERTDKRPPIGTRSSSSTVNLSASTPGSSSSSGSASNGATSNGGAATSMAGESAFWPKVSPDSAAATINDVINQQNNHHEFSLTPNGSATNGSTGNGPQSNGTDHPGGGPPQQQQQQQQQHHNQRDDAVDEMVGPAAARGPPDSVVGNGAPNGGNAGSGAANQASGQQQQQQQPPPQQQHNGTMNGGNLAIPPVSTPMSYDTGSIAKATSNSAFTPINAMPPHLNGLQHHHQLATQRPSYLYDAISFQNQKAAMSQSPSNAFPNQLISLHQIRNYAHQPAGGLMAGEHLLGVTVGPGGKDKG